MDRPISKHVIDLTKSTIIIDLTNVDDVINDDASINITQKKWITTSDKSIKWRGIDKRDGRYRLYKRTSKHVNRRPNKSGKLIDSFSKSKLIKIAWKIGVANPDGFDQNDAKYLRCGLQSGYIHYKNGWMEINKKIIGNYVWNRLYDTDKIIMR